MCDDSNNIEIERKYLIRNLPDLSSCDKKEIIQNYLVTGDESIRIRCIKHNGVSKYKLTYKSGSGLVRRETEIGISERTFNELKQKCGIPIIKSRYVYNDNGYIYEIDKFKNCQINPFVEVEFKSKEEAEKFTPPSWFGLEVTNQNKYQNQSIWKLIQD